MFCGRYFGRNFLVNSGIILRQITIYMTNNLDFKNGFNPSATFKSTIFDNYRNLRNSLKKPTFQYEIVIFVACGNTSFAFFNVLKYHKMNFNELEHCFFFIFRSETTIMKILKIEF